MADEATTAKYRKGLQLGTLLAVIGTLIGVLSLYYGRKDKEAEERENRPVVDFGSAWLIERETKRTHSPFLNDGGLDDVVHAQVMLINHGKHIAKDLNIWSKNFSFVRYVPVEKAALGEIAPNQSVRGRVESRNMLIDINDINKIGINHGLVILRVVIEYTDRLDSSRKFEDEACFVADDGTGLGMLGPHPRFDPPKRTYNPPLVMERCGQDVDK
ncbi:MAG TPA: hypothetical protein VNY51_03280 [Candidatus Dormibacteraeota bacterium]|jgi:hypothetical protein|nr:hypothetical protein [Candidatus Dormibacteraeota bacterium]